MPLIYNKNSVKLDDLVTDESINKIINFTIKHYGYYLDTYEDAKQESYICLMKSLEKYKNNAKCSFQTFYSKCLKNHLMGLNIKEYNKKSRMVYKENRESYQTLSPDVDYSMKYIEELKWLRPQEKKLIYQYFYETQTLKELAAQNGVSFQCIQKRILDLLKRISNCSLQTNKKLV